jgi:hypothetical protein
MTKGKILKRSVVFLFMVLWSRTDTHRSSLFLSYKIT